MNKLSTHKKIKGNKPNTEVEKPSGVIIGDRKTILNNINNIPELIKLYLFRFIKKDTKKDHINEIIILPKNTPNKP